MKTNKNNWPILGMLPRIFKIYQERTTEELALFRLARDDFGSDIPPMYFHFRGCEVALFITDPHLLEEVYVKNGKYLDKYYLVRDLIGPIVGGSIIFANSTED